MTPLEATTRAREAMLGRALPPGSVHDDGELVAAAEAAGGLCPRKGRALVAALLRVGLLARVGPGRVMAGPRFRAPVKEEVPTTVGRKR